MNLHEYQAKKLFADYGIQVPSARVASNAKEAKQAAKALGGDSWIVKAQVHAGGRGKAGGVKRVSSIAELSQVTEKMLGTQLVTPQTTADGLPVNKVLIESLSAIEAELYLGVLIDRSRNAIVFMASPMGGMDIEEVAASQPDQIFTVYVNQVVGLQAYQCRQIAFAMGLVGPQVKALTRTMNGLYRLFIEKDLSLIEINPLASTVQGELLALDAKINIDDNALYRQQALTELRDPSQEDEREYKAKQHELNYVTLNGDIGCMVNGAGLAMATMDLIKLHGGEPANFLDVGGGITRERVVEAFRLVISDSKVTAILVNIFGGIVRCDLIAEGIIQAMREMSLSMPVIVRLEGTNVEQGAALLNQSGLPVIIAQGLAEAATKVVKAARRLS
ncbi:MAG: ADP-forming succinate--CoA ligase subunit beta [Gammaproteobacteria bacterium]|nr:ADP-forming succinate--CoA ligase subunit beta [Gammaproteobacteria bacterium]